MERKIVSTLILLLLLSILPVISSTGALSLSQSTKIYIDPSTMTVPPYENFTVSIMIVNVTNLFAWQLRLKWDPQVLEVTNVTEADFLKSGGDTTWAVSMNQTEGMVFVVCLLLTMALPGVNGSGMLANVTFRSLSVGDCVLDLYDTKLFDSKPVSVATPPYLGDANNDLRVNAIDAAALAAAWGTSVGHPRYNPKVDFNNDGFVDLFDYLCVLFNFGRTYPGNALKPVEIIHEVHDGYVIIALPRTYEVFGPRADKLLINLYENAEAEWDALERGEIDITDWPLTTERYEKYTSAPWNNIVNVISVGPGVYKAVSRVYTGGTGGVPITPDDGENKYRNVAWQGVVDKTSLDDNFWSVLNMHPGGFESGDGENLTIRLGFSTPSMQSFNPIYGSTYWEQELFGFRATVCLSLYDSLLKFDPYTLDPIPWMTQDLKVGTYQHPVFGQCSKIAFALRSDVCWSDGNPVTVADVYFTLVELPNTLAARGLPPPNWSNMTKDILDLKISSPYNFEVLFRQSTIEFKVADKFPVLPKRVWKSIVDQEDPTTFAPDPNLIGSGPWRFKQYVAGSHILMVANSPNCTAKTNLPDSEPVTSPIGYFRFTPWYVSTYVSEPAAYRYAHKLPPEINLTLYNGFTNMYALDPIEDVQVYSNITVDGELLYENMRYFAVLNGTDEIDLDVVFPDPPKIPLKVTKTCKWHQAANTEGPGPGVGPYEYTYKISSILSVQGQFPQKGTKVQVWLTENNKKTQKEPLFETIMNRPFSIQKWYTVTLKAKYGELSKPYLKQYESKDPVILWTSVEGDISGSTFYDDNGIIDYPYKPDLPTPDFKVNILDISTAAQAYGSYPGHPRWNSIADVNGDYSVNIVDLSRIASVFGWKG